MFPGKMARNDDLESRVDRTLAASERQDFRCLVNLAGRHAQEMVESPEAAAAFLRCENGNLRRGAIQVLSWYWAVAPNTDIARSVVQIAKKDSDSHVRREALAWLGVIYRGSDNADVGALLARTVLDESEKVGTRKSAYDGLCCLRWRMKPSWAMSRFPEAIDWDYVRFF